MLIITKEIRTSQIEPPAPMGPFFETVLAMQSLLNSTNTNLTDSYWLCLDPRSAFHIGLGLLITYPSVTLSTVSLTNRTAYPWKTFLPEVIFKGM